MPETHGGPHDHQYGADNTSEGEERGRGKLLQPLSLPKNRSTGNLPISADPSDRSRLRMSLDASAALLDHDVLTRSSSLLTDHEHGLGLSGLHRIRQQQPPSRKPTIPGSNASSRSPSVVALSRTPSLSVLSHANSMPLSAGPTSPSFAEDLSRFPSESLHSFSFAHQSEDFIHSRQNVLKRSLEFMKDRMGWPMNSAQAGLASAQARVTGDVDAQNMLELLARAQIIGAGNLPNPDSTIDPGPLTGPAIVSNQNVFDQHFVPRSSSPEPISPIPKSMSNVSAAKSHDVSIGNAQAAVGAPADVSVNKTISEDSSRSTPDESVSSRKRSPPRALRPTTLKRTMTDTMHMSMENRLMDTMSQPFYSETVASPALTPSTTASANFPSALGSSVHGHTNRWVPAAQAIFTTEAKPPWTIIAANDLACLVFGVTKAEVRKTGILEVVQEERRAWLERKLLSNGDDDAEEERPESRKASPASSAASALLGGKSGITAQLLNKPNSRAQPPKYKERRSQTVHSGDPNPPKTRGSERHRSTLSRGVLLCGDVVPIQKRNGATGSASIWVKEKRVGLIWVLEEIHEDTAYITIDEEGVVQQTTGATRAIWGVESPQRGCDVGSLIPRIPRQGIDPNTGEIDFAQIRRRKFFTCPNLKKVNVPCTIEQVRGKLELRVSSYPHIAGMIVLDPRTLHIRSSNSVFCGALFGFEKPDGMSINALVPGFDKILEMLTEEEGLELLEGMVIPEDRFRRASGLLAVREHRPDASDVFLKPDGLPARHRDGSDLKIDVQMRVVKSEKQGNVLEETVIEGSDEENDSKKDDASLVVHQSEMVYALWITYSRHLHGEKPSVDVGTTAEAEAASPLHQPSPGQTPPALSPTEMESDDSNAKAEPTTSKGGLFSKNFKDVAKNAAAKLTGHSQSAPKTSDKPTPPRAVEPAAKPKIEDYTILEDMGQGAYGQVKLVRHKVTGKKAVLKYVTKRRILVDTWTRDRKLGTVPLEIHVLDYLRRPEFRHPNIVEMEGFFEDSVNYYIEMKPHGLPGMDLFDYIELRANMEESECRSIFKQVAQSIHFLHTKAMVVHRDIKDENVVMDGEGNIKLIDFGSAAYIKSGPFDVFVGTIDYAAPEVLAGKPYGGKEQDVWALGILLYTIIYKENPFYSIDEIMDRDLRIPYVMSEESIDLIRCMLDRDVPQRYDIEKVLAHPWLA
ncbi:Serine/threonine-protein kinase ppk6 [Emericellopsis cladophorae]|uniref:non-specific serine/threonine protein kinase n=1 Tax=Emericellopsis cladophorae TaxID=2686198 RepID=A0A9Q0BIM3_9HYPO|nr:Serine/threonine-protein kinase ppk6 [Emericellopsis cladophorae]KAI6785794.1 Serine/threonine-protein kinase ppk6 [Emericellopsis cladophorae]